MADDKKRKTVRITFRIDEDLAEYLTDKADDMGLSMSEYLRHLAKGEPMVRLETKHNIQKIKYELSMIGSNLNQIAHALNGTYYRYPEDAERVKDALYRLRKVLEKVWEMY